MTKEEFSTIKDFLYNNPDGRIPSLLRNYIETVTVTEPPKVPRTGKQNSTIHGFCDRLAEALNLAGKDMRVVIKPDYFVPWTTESVKEHIWRPIQVAMYGKKSTTELKKSGEITNIHKVIMRELGEKHSIEYIPFAKENMEALSGVRLAQHNNLSNENYPEYAGDAKF